MNNSVLQLGAQLKNIWKELGVNQRVSVALASALVVGGLLSLIFWSSRTEYALLYGKLEGSEASKVTAALDDAKVPYKVQGTSILVPSDKVHAMRMQLAGKGIRAGTGLVSRFLINRILASPISCSARIIFAPSRANFPAPSRK